MRAPSRRAPRVEVSVDADQIAAAEAHVSRYFEHLVAGGSAVHRHAMRRPRESYRAVQALRLLPVVDARLSDAPEGTVIRHLMQQYRFSRALTMGVTAAIAIPADGANFALGAARQTLRRKARVATDLGVRWSQVTDPAERRALLAIANAQEQRHASPQYRVVDPKNDDLLDVALWLAAYAVDGRPVLLSVTPVDGEWGVLRYFRTLDDGPEASATRYLMTQVLVERLSELGVRHLVDAARPHWLPNGLRHFQRMVGFRLIRVRIVGTRIRARA